MKSVIVGFVDGTSMVMRCTETSTMTDAVEGARRIRPGVMITRLDECAMREFTVNGFPHLVSLDTITQEQVVYCAMEDVKKGRSQRVVSYADEVRELGSWRLVAPAVNFPVVAGMAFCTLPAG